MSPKKSSAGSGKKTSARKVAPRKDTAPKAPSPMRKIEHAVGPNKGGLDKAAVAAHLPPESSVPPRARASAAANTPAPPDVSTAGKPPAETTTESSSDKGRE